jgi:hypothetical protein
LTKEFGKDAAKVVSNAAMDKVAEAIVVSQH